jgi:hypothetical protein
LTVTRVLILLLISGGVAAGQPNGATADVEVEPITCWWRSSTSAVRSGEPFNLALTCAVVEAEAARVVPDQSKLDPSVVQLQPFEVIGGTHAPDMRVPGKRFFQYDYRLRLINESAFGADVDVPELEITYRIESKVSRGESVQGKDLTYNLQPISIRLISLVPADTMDIREAPAAAFTAVEARESRSGLLRATAYILFGLSGVVLLVMAVNSLRRTRVVARADAWKMSPASIAAGVQRELADVRQQSRGGWDADLAGRALAALRVAASLVSGLPVGQSKLSTAAAAGQLKIPGALGRGGALVSGFATSQTVRDPLVADSLVTFTRARYGRVTSFETTVLDSALDTAISTAGRAASEHSWSNALLRRLRRG